MRGSSPPSFADPAGSGVGTTSAAIIVVLMMASQILNIFDRAVFSIAAPDMFRDLGLSPKQYGLLASAFYSLHSIAGICVGLWLVHRVRPLMLTIWLIAIWAVVLIPPVIIPSLAVLVISNTILGISEGPSFSAAVAATHEEFPPHSRGVPTSLLWAGALVGAASAPPALTLIISNFGWKSGFILCAALSASLFLALLYFARGSGRPIKAPVAAHTQDAPEGPIRARAGLKHWTHPTVVIMTLAGFCSYWMISFAFSWMYPMISLHWGYGAAVSGWVVSAIFISCAGPVLIISILSHKLLKRSVPFHLAVVLPVVLCLLAGALCFATSAMLPVNELKLAIFGLGIALMPVVGSNMSVIISHVTPTSARNRLLVVLASVMALSGLPAPYVTGLLLDRGGEHGYDWAFLCGAAVSLIGGLLSLTLVRASAVTPGDD